MENTLDSLIMQETYVEKVPTGAIVIIAGEYLPLDKAHHEVAEEPYFMTQGETAPEIGEQVSEWKLVEAFDFAS